jgi:hypothetical protein
MSDQGLSTRRSISPITCNPTFRLAGEKRVVRSLPSNARTGLLVSHRLGAHRGRDRRAVLRHCPARYPQTFHHWPEGHRDPPRPVDRSSLTWFRQRKNGGAPSLALKCGWRFCGERNKPSHMNFQLTFRVSEKSKVRRLWIRGQNVCTQQCATPNDSPGLVLRCSRIGRDYCGSDGHWQP